MNFKKYIKVNKPKSKICNITHHLQQSYSFILPSYSRPHVGYCYRDFKDTIHYIFPSMGKLYVFQNTDKIGKTEYSLGDVTVPYNSYTREVHLL